MRSLPRIGFLYLSNQIKSNIIINSVFNKIKFSNIVFWFFVTDPYFVVRFKISWQISCANWGLSEVKFLKYSSLIILRLIEWFPSSVTLLLIQVRFAPDIDGITRYMTGSVVTKTNIIIINVQKMVICLMWIIA